MHYDSPFTVPFSPSTANLITSLVARDPVTPPPSKPRVERKTIAPRSPRTRGMSRLKDGAAGRPVLWISFISDEHLLRVDATTLREQFLLESFMMDLPAMADHLCADCFRILWDSGDLFDRRREREDREICIKGFWRCLIWDLWGCWWIVLFFVKKKCDECEGINWILRCFMLDVFFFWL